MKVLDPSHSYELDQVCPDTKYKSSEKQTIVFVKRFRGKENHNGILNQELLRVLIDRVWFLDEEVPWALNKEIIHHLRMALALHEARALIRKTEKGTMKPENISTGTDGHFTLDI